MMIDVMLGLWNDGFRKQLIINNHDSTEKTTGQY
jgi:creatinine amidohydrolase/Fe(II)-dependent formamide hydrolase-like protein